MHFPPLITSQLSCRALTHVSYVLLVGPAADDYIYPRRQKLLGSLWWPYSPRATGRMVLRFWDLKASSCIQTGRKGWLWRFSGRPLGCQGSEIPFPQINLGENRAGGRFGGYIQHVGHRVDVVQLCYQIWACGSHRRDDRCSTCSTVVHRVSTRPFQLQSSVNS